MRIKNREFCLDKLYFTAVYKMLDFANKTIAISSSTKKDIIKLACIDSKKIEIIPPIYRDFKPGKTVTKKTIIGYLGAMGGRKRVYEFLKIAEIIKKKKIKNTEIHIYSGRGRDEKLLDDSKKYKDIIKLKGAAPEEKIEEIYNSFDFFVFPSQYEGLGLPIIEALMCGKPCFILKDAYFPKEVSEGCIKCKDSGEIVEDIIKIRKKGYEKESKKALDYSKKFDSEINLDKLIALYKN
jgi:glycosyltransferase involved in cell wall biosynthesis